MVFKSTQVQRIFLVLMLIVVAFSSCTLFDKDLEQDKHIATYRHQMLITLDSIAQPAERVDRFQLILKLIDEDKALITPRKKRDLMKTCYSFISNEYCHLHDYDEALRYANAFIESDNNDARGYFTRGSAYHEAGFDSLALRDYTQAINLNADYVSAYYNSGLIYQARYEYQKAIDCYSKAIKLKPFYLKEIYNNRGIMYYYVDKYDEAIEDYTNALAIDSVYLEAFVNRGNIYLAAEKYREAIEDYSKAIKIDSTYADAFSQRAFSHETLKEYDMALLDYRKALALDADNHRDQRSNSIQGIERLRKLGITK